MGSGAARAAFGDLHPAECAPVQAVPRFLALTQLIGGRPPRLHEPRERAQIDAFILALSVQTRSPAQACTSDLEQALRDAAQRLAAELPAEPRARHLGASGERRTE